METRVIKPCDVAVAGEIIKNGGVVSFPTETVYGLGASAFCPEAVKKIFIAKSRPSDNPLIVHICRKEQIEEIAKDISCEAKKLIDTFMPGPFTIILKKKSIIPDIVSAGLDSVGIRFPMHKTALAFIEAAEVPVAAPSANLSGKPSPTKAKHVIEDMWGRIDAIIDGEACDVGVESTIVDATGDTPCLLRPGGITYDELKAVVPNIKIDKNVFESVSLEEKPKCPGMKYKHYSPKAEVVVVEGSQDDVQNKIKELVKLEEGKTIGILTMFGAVYDDGIMIKAGASGKEYAKNLFDSLRTFDELGVDKVFAEFCDNDGYGLAVRNRLYKAAGYNVIKADIEI